MKIEQQRGVSRRDFLVTTVSLVAIGTLPAIAIAADKPKIGIIGSGGIGGGLGQLFAKAGYQVMLSARDVASVKLVTDKIGSNARAGSPAEAAAFGDVVIISVPFGAVAQVGRDNAAALKGKVVLDTCNPNEARDGSSWDAETRARATEAFSVGTGVADQKAMPGTKLVKAFNVVFANTLISDAGRAGDRIAVPLAADDASALAVAKQLVIDIGYDPVVVGGLATAKSWDTCHPMDKSIKCEGEKFHGPGLTAQQIRAMLNLR